MNRQCPDTIIHIEEIEFYFNWVALLGTTVPDVLGLLLLSLEVDGSFLKKLNIVNYRNSIEITLIRHSTSFIE